MRDPRYAPRIRFRRAIPEIASVHAATAAVKSSLIRSCGRRGRALTLYLVPARVVVFAIVGYLASCSPSPCVQLNSRAFALGQPLEPKLNQGGIACPNPPTPRLRGGSPARGPYESQREHPDSRERGTASLTRSGGFARSIPFSVIVLSSPSASTAEAVIARCTGGWPIQRSSVLISCGRGRRWPSLSGLITW